jgi:hypothetical protein
VKTTFLANFQVNGLTNINDETILTIDGTPYSYYTLGWKTFLWEQGTTHTITASTPITGWDSATHYFSSWGNGGGLSGTSGTYTMASSDTTVAVNYGSTAPAAGTSITINCNPTSVDKTGTDPATISGVLTSSSTGVSGKTIVLSYFKDVAWIQIGTTTTGAGGVYQYSWDVPATLANGQYVLKAEFAGDSTYTTSSAVTGTSGNGASLFVLPEYLWGGLAAMMACFAALVLFKKRNSIHIPLH